MADEQAVGPAGLTGFQREVEKARAARDLPLLLLLADEAVRFGGPWALEGSSIALDALQELGHPWLAHEAAARGRAQGVEVPSSAPEGERREPHAIVFVSPPSTPMRGTPRPFTTSVPGRVLDALERELDQTLSEGAAPCVGYAGAASACDIAFHERCEAHGVRTTVLLPVNPKAHHSTFEAAADRAQHWVARHDALLRRRPSRVFGLDLTKPPFIARDVEYAPWERITFWTLAHGFAHGADRTTVLVFADDPAHVEGTDVVKLARTSGARVAVLDATA